MYIILEYNQGQLDFFTLFFFLHTITLPLKGNLTWRGENNLTCCMFDVKIQVTGTKAHINLFPCITQNTQKLGHTFS